MRHPKIDYGIVISPALERNNIERFGASGYISCGVLFDDDEPEVNLRRAIARKIIQTIISKEKGEQP